jgi:serine/threonine protein kinase
MEHWQQLFGQATLESWGPYERHLEACPSCRERLDQAEECGEALRRLGRKLGDPTSVPADPQLTEVVVRIQETINPDPGCSLQPESLCFLQPSDRPGVLGTLGQYEVLEVIGQGGMGVVLKAFDPGLQRPVAIKVLAEALAGSVTARQRFAREARAAAAVCDEYIVPIHAVQEEQGRPYLVMQHIAGESLQSRLDRTGPMPVEEVVRIGLQTARGLAAAHAQGLIHRDIKPANLLLEGEPYSIYRFAVGDNRWARNDKSNEAAVRVKITDFGLARMTDDTQLTQNGVVAGTPEYMAPEQARGERTDHRTDLFSFGSVLYALCTGVPPFRGATSLDVLRQVSEQEPAPLRSLKPDVPAWLESLITRLQAKDPADRFQSAAEVAGLLESHLEVSTPEPPAPALLGHTWRSWPLLAVLVFLLVVPTGLFGLARILAQVPPKQAGVVEQHLKFQTKPEDSEGIQLSGPSPEECVRFEPEGLRITLPLGFEGERPPTGLRTNIAVQGDFEITMSFELLKMPGPENAGTSGAKLHLILDAAKYKAGFSRVLTPWGGSRLTAWLSRPGQKQLFEGFPNEALSGRLRLVRTGPTLSYFFSQDPDTDFTLLKEFPFTEEEVNNISLTAQTSSPRASLDARITDLHIRAASLPNLSATPYPRIVLIFGAGLGLLLAVVLGIFLAMRQGRNPRSSASTIESTS